MIDIKILREKPEIVKDSQRRRAADLGIIDQVLEHDKKWRTLLQKADKLKHKRNLINMEIAALKKAGKSAAEKIKGMQKLALGIRKNDESLERYKQTRDDQLCRIPNIIHTSVPPGKDESENVKLRAWGKIPKFSFKPQDHIDLGLNLDLFDTERAAKTSGARFYYLKNEVALLELALVNYSFNRLLKKGFTPIIPPTLVRERVMHGVGMLPLSKEEIYKVENEDLYMILTAEHAIASMHMDEILEKEELPKRYVAFSPCYRTEAGSHGRDTKGIFRTHQFDKVEMFTFCSPENSWEEHEFLLKNAEALVQGLKLPYRVMNICTGDLGNTAAKKYDIDAWLPGQNAYREIISCSNCTDYQARRLNIRYRTAPGAKPEPVHTINSTALAIGRTIVTILENYQQKDGSVKVPRVLQPYMGLKVIKRKD